MLKYENDNYILYYDKCDLKYLEKLINTLNERVPNILEFFKLKTIRKITIKLYNNLNDYKENITNSFKKDFLDGNSTEERQYESWMIANTEDGNINMLSLDLVKQIEGFELYTEEEFCYNIAHEFTHICQQEIKSDSPGWFWEVLATTLGNPECQRETNDKFSLDDLNNNFDKIDGYGAVYKIGKYLFENYDQEFILELTHDNEKLKMIISDVISNLNTIKKH